MTPAVASRPLPSFATYERRTADVNKEVVGGEVYGDARPFNARILLDAR
jgi:hypothetical protein